MKKFFVMTAFLLGSLYASAQTTPAKNTKGDQKTQKKGATKNTTVVELKSTSSNTANAPLSIPFPKPDADTAAVPAVKQQ